MSQQLPSSQHPSVLSAQSDPHNRANQVKHESALPNQTANDLPVSPRTQGNTNWSSPRTSQRPFPFPAPAQASPNPSAWGPTPPRSDSGVSSIPLHAQGPSRPPTNIHPAAPTPMSTVNYVPAQYGPLGIDENSLHGSNYQIDQQYRQHIHHPPVSQAYDFSQPEAYGTSSMRTSSPMPMQQSYGEEYRLSNAYDMNRAHPSDAVPRPLPSTTLGSNASSYTSSAYQRSPSVYDSSMYTHQMPPGASMAGHVPSSMAYGQPMYGASSMAALPRSMSSVSADSMRGGSQKPKPQCWEHGCNGRKFSTFSNLLRHQREKSGTASKSYCPKCGAEFTRTTARNGHLAHDKCSKQRKSSSEGRT